MGMHLGGSPGIRTPILDGSCRVPGARASAVSEASLGCPGLLRAGFCAAPGARAWLANWHVCALPAALCLLALLV